VSAKPEADHVAPAPRKSKKMLIIVALAVLVLGLGGGGGWFYLSKKNAALDDEEQAHAAPVHKGPPTYLPIDNMVVNLADPGGEKVAQVGVTLELSDAKAPDKVKAYMPAIRSSVLMLISQRTAEELLLREGKERLAADILTEAAKHFISETADGKKAGKSKPAADRKHGADDNPVRGVLFSSFIVQ
jgi:flagellar protein FliL